MGLPYPLLFNWQLASFFYVDTGAILEESPIQHYEVVHWSGNPKTFGKNVTLWSFAHMKG